MIALVLAQLAARWGQAVTLFALSLAASVATVSVPVYVATVDRAAVASELAGATPFELTVQAPPLQAGPADASSLMEPMAAVRAAFTWLEPVTTVQIRVQGLRPDAPAAESHLLIARDGFCQRVEYRAGRCPLGSREVALPADLAGPAELAPGAELRLTPVITTDFGFQPDGPPVTLVVVGVFDPVDPADPYWRTGQDPLGFYSPPSIFTTRVAIETMVHSLEIVHLDAVLPPGQLTADRVPEFGEQLVQAERRLAEQGAGSGSLSTGLPRLMDRITSHGDQARALLPIVVAPLVALCWFVIYLAVGHGAAARRHEFGMVALRGARSWTRASAVVTECLLPVLAGAPAGLLAAHLLVDLVDPGGAGSAAPGGLLSADPAQLRSAGLAAAGAVLAALLALRREVAAPVAQLLRSVPPRRRAAVATAEVLAVALAAAAVVELRGLDGELVGVMVAAPAVVMLAVAVVVARAVRPVSALVGRWALRRGWLGPSLAALALARRPGAAGLVMVLALVLGLLGFSVTSTDVAATGRDTEAQRALGAARVLAVEEVDRGTLLQAVRAADPSGRYAMAVMTAAGQPDDPPVVAVDATRFAAVVPWSERYGLACEPDGNGCGAACEPDQDGCAAAGPEQVAAALRPPAPEPVLVGDGELTAELSLDEFTTDGTVTLALLLVPPAGRQVVATFGPVTRDQPTYRAEVTGCGEGCRLAGVAVATNETTGPDGSDRLARISLAVHRLRQDGVEVGPAGWLADRARWRVPERGRADELAQVVVEDGQLRITRPGAEPGIAYPALTADVPYPLPVVTAGALPTGDLVTSIDNQLIRVSRQATLAGIPGTGGTGVLMDLEYADRLATEPGTATEPQVWLTADAPPEVVGGLADQGLVITGERTIADAQAASDGSGAALALRFFLLAAGIAVLVGLAALALVIAVDRRTWRRGLRELRAQGLAERTATTAALWSYGGIVVAAAAAGLLAAAAAWLVAGRRLPLGVDESVLVHQPQWTAVVPVWLLVVVVLLASAVAAAWWHADGGRLERRAQPRRVGD